MFMIWTYGQPTDVLVNNTDSKKGTGSTRYQMTNGSLKATTVRGVSNGCESWSLAMGVKNTGWGCWRIEC